MSKKIITREYLDEIDCQYIEIERVRALHKNINILKTIHRLDQGVIVGNPLEDGTIEMDEELTEALKELISINVRRDQLMKTLLND